jgi:hypothetical protein
MSNHTKLEWLQAPNADLMHEIYTQDPANPNSTRLICQVAKFKDPFSQAPRRFGDPESAAQQVLNKEWQANAKLITAAPKLLAAVEQLLEVTTPSEEPVDSQKYMMAYNNARKIVDSLK